MHPVRPIQIMFWNNIPTANTDHNRFDRISPGSGMRIFLGMVLVVGGKWEYI